MGWQTDVVTYHVHVVVVVTLPGPLLNTQFTAAGFALITERDDFLFVSPPLLPATLSCFGVNNPKLSLLRLKLPRLHHLGQSS